MTTVDVLALLDLLDPIEGAGIRTAPPASQAARVVPRRSHGAAADRDGGVSDSPP